MKTTRFNPPLASVTSATPNTAVALAPANTRARLATYTASSANTAPVTIGPGATLASETPGYCLEGRSPAQLF